MGANLSQQAEMCERRTAKIFQAETHKPVEPYVADPDQTGGQ
jgi:hypothetical protein